MAVLRALAMPLLVFALSGAAFAGDAPPAELTSFLHTRNRVRAGHCYGGHFCSS